jgi:DNA repair exonuclease SbcCD ATPase subunit
LRAYKHQLEHAEQFAEGKCETCGQVVQIKDPKVLQARVKKLTAQAKQHRAYAEYKAARGEQKKLRVKLEAADAEITKLTAELSNVQPWVAIDEELQDLPKKPKKFEGKKLQTVVLKRMLEELYERRAMLEAMRPHVETILEYLQLTKADKLKAKNASGLSSKMNTIQERLSKVSAKLEVHQTISVRVTEMRDRLVEMKRELRDEEPLRLLVQGYQDKNIKKMAVEAISQRLMALVNKYSSQVFPETYRFEFEWGTQVSLMVHRRYGKKTLTSDVRKLSGAESKLFTIVLVLALLAFVPSHKRCSMLILDEPTANLSKEMTQSFQDLLPVLNALIPSVIIVTPKSDEIYEGAKPFTVVKNQGVASIVEGFPHQVK